MNEFQIERLRKLALHLIKHNLEIQKKPSISVLPNRKVVSEEKIQYFLFAVEEVSKLFPTEWSLNEEGQPFWIYDGNRIPLTSTMNFFGVHTILFMHLFVPTAQNPVNFGGIILPNNATPKKVAENILAFIERLEIQRN